MTWLKWKIWYGDGSTSSSAEGSPYYAPRENVQVIVGSDTWTGRYIVDRREAYWWDLDYERWFGGDREGERSYMRQLGPRVVLYGRWVPDEVYNRCIAAALSDPDFPAKSAWARGESRHGQ